MIIAVSNRLHRGLFVTFLTTKVSPFCKQVALALRFLSSFRLKCNERAENLTMWHEKIDPVQKIPHREMNVDDFNNTVATLSSQVSPNQQRGAWWFLDHFFRIRL